ncbi:hippocampus abundant transcript-like protein 1 [Ipomoea triloba]|uniref:hippocampus abundant transcript-like protein 1 n=1 Tax=Ipomoea triloba TaxID=35885 RepID=UPI00125E27F6|nr:hippocampus abundant transcript-like protein 1 [Ipomoea triloba]
MRMRVLKPLVHLLVPLCVHWIAEEMSKPMLVDITTNALCDGQSSCSQSIYINGLQHTVVGILQMAVVPFLGQLSDDYGRKPLLLLTSSTTIIPFVLLAINKSKGFVYAYYVTQTISYIISQGSIFCISIAYAADVVDETNRATAFSWITGLFSASHVLGDLVSRFLHEDYNIFQAALCLLIFVPLYMALHLVETVASDGGVEQSLPCTSKVKKFCREQCYCVRSTLEVVISSPTLKCACLVFFFYQLGMSGIDSVLPHYLKAAFGFGENPFSEILMAVGAGSIVSQMVVLPLVNPFAGEKVILCIALLASIVYALLYGLAWASWVTYLGAPFGVIYILVIPVIYAVISRASSSDDQGKMLGFFAGVQSLASLLSPFAMSPLTNWFLSENAPFNCKGFSIICASLCMTVALCCACALKLETPWKKFSEDDDEENTETPLLTSFH